MTPGHFTCPNDGCSLDRYPRGVPFEGVSTLKEAATELSMAHSMERAGNTHEALYQLMIVVESLGKVIQREMRENE